MLDNNKLRISVLDHGFVELKNSMGSDMAIVQSARVSYKGLYEQETLTEKDEKLIRSLIRRKHTSPFECVSFTFIVKAPIFVLRQWHRHRTWSYNEVSARYKRLPNDFYVPATEQITHQMKHEKQMRDDVQNRNWSMIQGIIQDNNKAAYDRYEQLIALDCPRELARSVLPVNIYSEMYATVNLHNLVHFLKLRCDEHAQYEIRVYADAMLELAKTVAPVAMDEFERMIRNG